MAKRLEQMPDTMRSVSQYPWEEWLDGGAWQLTEGEDFKTTIRNFQATLSKTASRRGLRIQSRTFKEDDKNQLAIQAFRDVND